MYYPTHPHPPLLGLTGGDRLHEDLEWTLKQTLNILWRKEFLANKKQQKVFGGLNDFSFNKVSVC